MILVRLGGSRRRSEVRLVTGSTAQLYQALPRCLLDVRVVVTEKSDQFLLIENTADADHLGCHITVTRVGTADACLKVLSGATFICDQSCCSGAAAC